jgi:hypothetical protein
MEESMRVALCCALTMVAMPLPVMAQARTDDVVVMRRTVAPPRPRSASAPTPTPTPTPAASTCPNPARNLFPGNGDTGNYLAVISFSSSSEMQRKALEVCNGPLQRSGRTACLVAIFDTGTGAIVYTPVGTTKLNANSGTNGTTFWASLCS